MGMLLSRRRTQLKENMTTTQTLNPKKDVVIKNIEQKVVESKPTTEIKPTSTTTTQTLKFKS